MKQYTENNYSANVEELAQDIFNEDKETFFENVRDLGSRLDPYAFFEEEVHNEVDREFTFMSLVECAVIIDNTNNEETDSGLWDGQDPKQAIQTMAFFCLRNDIHEELKNVIAEALAEKKDEIESIIDEIDNDRTRYSEELTQAQDKLEDLEAEEDEEAFEDEIEELQEEIEALQKSIDSANETIEEYEDFIFNIDQVIEMV